MDELNYSMLPESFEEMKYKAEKLKAKWNKFWSWVWGEDDETSYYNTFSKKYDRDKFQTDVLDVYDEMDEDEKKKSLKLKWMKVDENVEKNIPNIKEIIKNANVKNQKGFWCTSMMLDKKGINIDDCSFDICVATLSLNDKFIENIAVLITSSSKRVEMIEILKDYESIITWKEIYKYISSDKFYKGKFDSDFIVTLYNGDTKKYEQAFKNGKEDKENAKFIDYKIIIKK